MDTDIQARWEDRFSVWAVPICMFLAPGLRSGWIACVRTTGETRYQAGPAFHEFKQQREAQREGKTWPKKARGEAV